MTNNSDTKINRLLGMRTYLVGQIDFSEDLGQGWRQEITPFLNKLGVIVFNPCDKPTQKGSEIGDDQILLRNLQQEEKYSDLAQKMREIRSIDLRMVDISDFIIVRFDMNFFMCGSMEEITLANKQKKPVLIYCPQGKQKLARWIYGMLPLENIFGDLDCLFEYLKYIDESPTIDDLGRWRFFDYARLMKQIG